MILFQEFSTTRIPHHGHSLNLLVWMYICAREIHRPSLCFGLCWCSFHSKTVLVIILDSKL
ncbi:hypothetical protein KP509_39G024900 [Ceratopteris richardii]|uniref:Uncharacterized protein n=2 Tax=Ceratopteris richardii TaxID=49495 RepID=A0A8T2Q041_CERRI|nr:hypothetical protein KP509_39G024900 [Ceratopteris richardii]